MANPTAVDAQGAVSTGDNTNPVFDTHTLGTLSGVFVGDITSVTIAPPDGEMHPDATLYADGCAAALTQDGLTDTVTSAASPLHIGAWTAPVVLWLKVLQSFSAPKLHLPESGYIPLPVGVSGGAQSDSSADGAVAEVVPIAGGASSTSGASGAANTFGVAQDISGGAGSDSAAGGSMTEVAPVSGGAVSNAVAGGSVALAPASPTFAYDGSVPITDKFDVSGDGFSVVSGQLVFSSPTPPHAPSFIAPKTSLYSNPNNQKIAITYKGHTGAADNAGIWLFARGNNRVAAPTRAYYLALTNFSGGNTYLYFRKVVSGTTTDLGTPKNVTIATGDVFSIEAVGTSIVAKKNGVAITGFSVTDSAIASGSVVIAGIANTDYVNASTTTIDDISITES